MPADALLLTDFKDLKLYRRGKVRDVYDLGDKLLIVSTDRISCFDVVLPSGIPDKGRVLTALSCFWFDFLKNIIPNHFISADVSQYPAQLQKYAGQLQGRSMLVHKTTPFAVECVVRGYLSGSGWKEYQKSGAVCGIKLPPGLRESDKLSEPIFTPSTKADIGHDANVEQKYVERVLGKETADKLAQGSIAIYRQSRDYADARGIIIADTKFEFGLYPVRNGSSIGDISNGVNNGKIILIDEVLTPDSSRFWPKEQYQPGWPQPSFDKQFVRDYLETLDWDKTAPGPELPAEIIQKTRAKYLEAYAKLTGKSLERG